MPNNAHFRRWGGFQQLGPTNVLCVNLVPTVFMCDKINVHKEMGFPLVNKEILYIKESYDQNGLMIKLRWQDKIRNYQIENIIPHKRGKVECPLTALQS